jgi:hypothetical protein
MRNQQGFALITVYLLLSALLALLGAYFTITNIELATTRHSKDSITGFYSAEAGLNLRAEQVRGLFQGYNRPAGTAVDTSIDVCTGGNVGSGDFVCQDFSLNNRTVQTYIVEDPANPYNQPVPAGDRYEGLDMQEYRYTVVSEARNIQDRTEAILELRFKSRLVPMFQFVAFYDKDLEIAPGQLMNLSGPIHTNGDLYLNGNVTLNINGQVTTSGTLYRGRKNDNTCNNNSVLVYDPLSLRQLQPTCGSRTAIPNSSLGAWNDMIQAGVAAVTVPEPEILDADPANTYFNLADLRLALRVDASRNPITTNSPTGVEVRTTANEVDEDATDRLHSCPGNVSGRPVGTTSSFQNNREGYTVRMLEVDVRSLFDCIHNVHSNEVDGFILGGGGASRALDDSSEGGLVFHFTVDGDASGDMDNRYGVRLRNAAELQSTLSGVPLVRGLTVVSPQPLYTAGDYNALNKIPAAILVDSFNALSNNWSWTSSAGDLWQDADTANLTNRVAVNTIFNAAVLAGTGTTGGSEGPGGQGGAYNGGLENYPRFHENWTGDTFLYRGSFVSLNVPRKVNGAWVYGSNQYTAPVRDWDYDTDFNDAANLPPLTPRFVYLRQELFVRDFEQ